MGQVKTELISGLTLYPMFSYVVKVQFGPGQIDLISGVDIIFNDDLITGNHCIIFNIFFCGFLYSRFLILLRSELEPN